MSVQADAPVRELSQDGAVVLCIAPEVQWVLRKLHRQALKSDLLIN